MNEEKEITLVRDILLSVAPTIATRALDKLNLTVGDAYSNQPAEGFTEARNKIFDAHAGYAIELASRMAGKFAQLHDAALSPTQTQKSLAQELLTAARQQISANPAKKIRGGPSSISP
jgi:hypothetical protein